MGDAWINLSWQHVIVILGFVLATAHAFGRLADIRLEREKRATSNAEFDRVIERMRLEEEIRRRREGEVRVPPAGSAP